MGGCCHRTRGHRRPRGDYCAGPAPSGFGRRHPGQGRAGPGNSEREGSDPSNTPGSSRGPKQYRAFRDHKVLAQDWRPLRGQGVDELPHLQWCKNPKRGGVHPRAFPLQGGCSGIESALRARVAAFQEGDGQDLPGAFAGSPGLHRRAFLERAVCKGKAKPGRRHPPAREWRTRPRGWSGVGDGDFTRSDTRKGPQGPNGRGFCSLSHGTQGIPGRGSKQPGGSPRPQRS